MSTSGQRRQVASGLSIGQVLDRLQSEFRELTLSKLRFLEEQGLVSPDRTKSGYRKFSPEHIERIRLILTLQREHYLPLKVIAEMLDEKDSGREPVISSQADIQVSQIVENRPVVTRAELLRETGGTMKFLNESISAGLLPAVDLFSSEMVTEFQSLLRLSEIGISPRHLRSIRVSCERDAQLIAHASNARGMHTPSAPGREATVNVADHISNIRAGVLRRMVQQRPL